VIEFAARATSIDAAFVDPGSHFQEGVVIVTKLHRILAAVDFSEPARAAFDHALELSRLHGAELLAVHAVPTERRFNWHARERMALVEALRHAAATAGVRFTVSVQHGDPAGVILLHATSRRADLIVLGTSDRSGFDRFRLGSVAETVVVEATQPVLVVPAGGGSTAGTPAPLKNILVAVDFADGSREVIERARSLADGSSRVTVVHVVRGVPSEYASRRLSHRLEAEYQRHLVRDAWRRIRETVPANANVGLRVVTGDTAAAISRVATEVDADLILMGVTPRSAIGRLVFGSTAARVIRSSRRQVLAVPAPVKGAAAVPLAVAA